MIAEHGIVADPEGRDAGQPRGSAPRARQWRGGHRWLAERGGRRARRHSPRRYSRPCATSSGGESTRAAASLSVSAACPPRSGSSDVSRSGRSGSRFQLGLQRGAGLKPIAQQGQVARAAAPGNQSGQAPGRCRAWPSALRAPGFAAESASSCSHCTSASRASIAGIWVSGARKVGGQQPPARRGHAAVDAAEQASGDVARAVSGKSPGCRGSAASIAICSAALSGAARQGRPPHPSGSRRDRPAGRRQRPARPGRARRNHRGSQRRTAAFSARSPVDAVEAALAGGRRDSGHGFRRNRLGRRQPGQLGLELARAAGNQFEPAGRNIRRGNRPLVAGARRPRPANWRFRCRADVSSVSVPGVTRRTIARSTSALDPRALRASAGLSVCSAIATRLPAADQPRQIGFGRMDRDAAHRDRLAAVRAALGQRDVEACGGRLGVVEEQLEEIAHPVEQQCIPRLGLEAMILRHHRRLLGGRIVGAGHRSFGRANCRRGREEFWASSRLSAWKMARAVPRKISSRPGRHRPAWDRANRFP